MASEIYRKQKERAENICKDLDSLNRALERGIEIARKKIYDSGVMPECQISDLMVSLCMPFDLYDNKFEKRLEKFNKLVQEFQEVYDSYTTP